MNRSRARRSSLLAVALALVALCTAMLAPSAVRAQTSSYSFDGAPLRFDHPIALEDDVAVTTRDSGLQRFLKRLGATLAYGPGQRYVTVTSADRRVIAFTLGDKHYQIAGVQADAAFAPFVDGGDIVIPLLSLARALYVQPLTIGDEIVLQPVLGALDVRADGPRTIVTLRGALPLRATRSSETADRLVLVFPGVGTTLAASRHGVGAGLDRIDIASAGTPRSPATTVTLSGARGATHRVDTQTAPNEVTVEFAPAGVALGASAPLPAAPAPAYATPSAYATAVNSAVLPPSPPPPMTSASVTPAPYGGAADAPAGSMTGAASVTGVAIEDRGDALTLRIGISGQTTFTWHRLADDRWYVDIAGASLSGAGRDERPNSAVVASVRVRQIGTPDAPVVRVAVTMKGDRRVEINGYDGGVLVAIGSTINTEVARSGSGRIGPAGVATSGEPTTVPLPSAAAPEATPWKFGPGGPAAGAGGTGKLIVIDPGHGGDDTGAAHNGLMEKNLTLDIAQRLRTQLVAQGWTVKMTRETDVDPYDPATLAAYRADGKPNPDDRAYLQTRADVANNASARMFISIHVNSSTSSGPAGTTTYYYKPQDAALATAVHRALMGSLSTQNDGTRKERFYVLNHTTMPSILVETAFVSNPSDAALLADPGFRQHIADAIAAGVKAYTGGGASVQPVSVNGGS